MSICAGVGIQYWVAAISESLLSTAFLEPSLLSGRPMHKVTVTSPVSSLDAFVFPSSGTAFGEHSKLLGSGSGSREFGRVSGNRLRSSL